MAPIVAQRFGGPGLPAQSGSLTERDREDAARVLDAVGKDTEGCAALSAYTTAHPSEDGF